MEPRKVDWWCQWCLVDGGGRGKEEEASLQYFQVLSLYLHRTGIKSPKLQMGKLSPIKVKNLVQVHPSSLNPGLSYPGAGWAVSENYLLPWPAHICTAHDSDFVHVMARLPLHPDNSDAASEVKWQSRKTTSDPTQYKLSIRMERGGLAASSNPKQQSPLTLMQCHI